MYLTDGVDVFKEKVTVLELSEELLLRHIEKWSSTDRTLVQAETMQFLHFHNMYKDILKRVFSNTHDKVLWKITTMI